MLGARRRILAAVLSAACIAVYTVLVGVSASVVRAALMGGLGLFARQLGRRQDGLNSLAFVAALMALQNPLILEDPGFQLSFTATLGLILYAEPLTQAFTRLAARHLPGKMVRRLASPVGEYFLFTLAAQLLSLPVTLYHFGRLSLVSVVANPAILPEWIATLYPQLVLLSVGAADRRGLPDPEVLEAVEGYPLLRTDRNGWIHLATDGERMWVEVERH